MRLIAIVRGIVSVQILGLDFIVLPCAVYVDVRNVKHVVVRVLFHVTLLSSSLITTCGQCASNFLLERCLAWCSDCLLASWCSFHHLIVVWLYLVPSSDAFTFAMLLIALLIHWFTHPTHVNLFCWPLHLIVIQVLSLLQNRNRMVFIKPRNRCAKTLSKRSLCLLDVKLCRSIEIRHDLLTRSSYALLHADVLCLCASQLLLCSSQALDFLLTQLLASSFPNISAALLLRAYFVTLLSCVFSRRF